RLMSVGCVTSHASTLSISSFDFTARSTRAARWVLIMSGPPRSATRDERHSARVRPTAVRRAIARLPRGDTARFRVQRLCEGPPRGRFVVALRALAPGTVMASPLLKEFLNAREHHARCVSYPNDVRNPRRGALRATRRRARTKPKSGWSGI